MAENDIKVVLTVEDKASGDIKQFQNNAEKSFNKANESVKKSQNAFNDLGNEIKGSFTNAIKGAIVAYAGFEVINKVTGFLVTARKEYQDSVRVQMQLRTALGYTSTALNEQADALGKKLVVDNDEITAVQAMLANYVKNDEQIRKLTPAVLDLAAATGQDMASAANIVARAISDDNNELGKYKIAIEGANGSAQRIDSVIRGLNRNFSGQAEATAEAKDGIDRLSVAWNQFKEDFAKTFSLRKKTDEELLAIQKKLYDDSLIMRGENDERTKRLLALYNQELERINKKKNDAIAAADKEQADKELNILKEKNKKKAEEEKKAAQDRLEIQINAYYALNEAIQIVRDKRAEGEANTEKLIQDASLKNFNSFSEDFEAQENARLNNSIVINKQYTDDQKKLAYESVSYQIGLIASLFEGQKKYIALYKTIAIAQATMDTYASAVSAYNSAVKVPIVGPVLAPVAAGVAIATGLANVSKIAATKFARGGMSAGGYAMVGEEGPEMMYVPSGARIYNSNETRNMTNNTNNNVTVNVMGSNGRIIETLRASLRSGSGDSFVRDLKNALAVV